MNNKFYESPRHKDVMKSRDKNYTSSNVGFYNYLISYLIDAETVYDLRHSNSDLRIYFSSCFPP